MRCHACHPTARPAAAPMMPIPQFRNAFRLMIWLQQAYTMGSTGGPDRYPLVEKTAAGTSSPGRKGLHGIHGSDATPAPLGGPCGPTQTSDAKACRGILALAERLPQGVLGIDADAYDGKNGEQTVRGWDAQFGTSPTTYRVTARRDGVSGIRLYQVPVGFYPKETTNSGVEFLRPPSPATRSHHQLAPHRQSVRADPAQREAKQARRSAAPGQDS